MIKHLISKMSLGIAGLAFASIALADPTGTWQTVDDQTGEAKATVKITLEKGKYVGRIQKYYAGSTCTACTGKYKNKSLSGATILWGLKPEGGNVYSGGKILDPKNDKTYNASLTDNGSTLTIRGYVGVKALGRNQTWTKVD